MESLSELEYQMQVSAAILEKLGVPHRMIPGGMELVIDAEGSTFSVTYPVSPKRAHLEYRCGRCAQIVISRWHDSPEGTSAEVGASALMATRANLDQLAAHFEVCEGGNGDA